MTRPMIAWFVALAACRGDARPSATTPRDLSDVGETPVARVPDAGAPIDAQADAGPPLAGFFEALPVTGHPDAWMSLPTGATGKRPVVIVIHGAGDRPDWQCGGWRRATGEFPFVVCPRGGYAPGDSTKNDVRYTHRGGAALLAYIDDALAALEAKYPAYVDTSTPLLVGFSLGASEILALAVQDPARFPRIVLVEGATSAWTDARIAAYLAGGGQRVLYAAGQRGNESAAKTAAAQLRAKGLDARVVYAPVHHTFDPPLEDAVHCELGWLVAGDARWPPDQLRP
jgi:pimeloyl-ACP methyl ester carboxylesterase